MLDFIQQWSVNIVALVLFTVIIEILLPSGKMKKHVGLVTGTVLIIAIITPLAGALDKDFDFGKIHAANSNTFDKLQIEKDSKHLEEMQMKQIVEVYRQKIISQMEDLAKETDGVKDAKADIIFNEDYNSSDFGTIKRAYLEIETVRDSSSNLGDSSSKVGDSSSISTEPVRKIERIKVGDTPKGGKKSGKGTGKESADDEVRFKEDDESDQDDRSKYEDEKANRNDEIRYGDDKANRDDKAAQYDEAGYENDKAAQGNQGNQGRFDEKEDDIDPALKKKIQQKIAEVFGMDYKDVIVSKMKR